MTLAALKGYRTVLFNLAIGGTTLLGLHVSPDLVGKWLDVIIPTIVVSNILLRAFTDAPMFNRLAGDLHLSGPQMAEIREAVASVGSGADLPAAIADLTDKVNVIAKHPLFDPAVAAQVTTLLTQTLAPPAPAAPVVQPSTEEVKS